MMIVVNKDDVIGFLLSLYIGEKIVQQMFADNYTFLSNGRVSFRLKGEPVINADSSKFVFIGC